MLNRLFKLVQANYCHWRIIPIIVIFFWYLLHAYCHIFWLAQPPHTLSLSPPWSLFLYIIFRNRSCWSRKVKRQTASLAIIHFCKDSTSSMYLIHFTIPSNFLERLPIQYLGFATPWYPTVVSSNMVLKIKQGILSLSFSELDNKLAHTLFWLKNVLLGIKSNFLVPHRISSLFEYFLYTYWVFVK